MRHSTRFPTFREAVGALLIALGLIILGYPLIVALLLMGGGR